MLNKKQTILTEEAIRSHKVFDRVCHFFKTPDWTIPIKSFIEEYCLIFSPDANYETLKEKKRIFTEYKLLINELLSRFLA